MFEKYVCFYHRRADKQKGKLLRQKIERKIDVAMNAMQLLQSAPLFLDQSDVSKDTIYTRYVARPYSIS